MRVAPARFEDVFHSTDRVSGYTHDFYKYPARFSPGFVRYFLESLTEPGDYVLDPFMGGGTTIVEAVASARNAIGSDINELAQFVARAKTTPLSQEDIGQVRAWVQDVRSTIDDATLASLYVEPPIRNLPIQAYPFFATATRLVERLGLARRRRFARCALVRVGQWALDARSNSPTTAALCDELETRVDDMFGGLSDLVSAAGDEGIHKNKITGTRLLLSCSASDLSLTRVLGRRGIRPRLVLTSPPYPGVHVLYHRWQVAGRRETPAPYWLADVRDGHGASYYTMGSRSPLGLRNYFAGIAAAFRNLRRIVAPDTTVVQLISFSDAAIQLPRYLEAMSLSGFGETSVHGINSRQVRVVPNRKWYNQRRTRNDASREVLLMHRPID